MKEFFGANWVYLLIGVAVLVVVAIIAIVVAKKGKKESLNQTETAQEAKTETVQETKTEEVKEEKKEVVAKKPAAKKPSAKTTTEKKPAAKKTTEKKPAVKAEKEEVQVEQKVEELKAESTKTEEEAAAKPATRGGYRVTFDKVQKDWVVKRDGSQRASKRCATKEEALKAVKVMAAKSGEKIKAVHKKDGKFQSHKKTVGSANSKK